MIKDRIKNLRAKWISKLIIDDKKLLEELYTNKKYIACVLKSNRKMYKEINMDTLDDVYLSRFM